MIAFRFFIIIIHHNSYCSIINDDSPSSRHVADDPILDKRLSDNPIKWGRSTWRTMRHQLRTPPVSVCVCVCVHNVMFGWASSAARFNNSWLYHRQKKSLLSRGRAFADGPVLFYVVADTRRGAQTRGVQQHSSGARIIF